MSNNFKSFRFLLFKSIYFLKTNHDKEFINEIVETIEISDHQNKYQITWFDKVKKEYQVEKKKFKFYTRGDVLFNEPLGDKDIIEKNNSIEIDKILKIIFDKKIPSKQSKFRINSEIAILTFYNILSFILFFFNFIDYKLIFLINAISLSQILIKNNIIKNFVLFALSIVGLKVNLILFLIINLIILLNILILNKKFTIGIFVIIFANLIYTYVLISSQQNENILIAATILIFIFLFRNLFFKSSNLFVFTFLLMIIAFNNLDQAVLILPFIALIDIIFFKLIFKLSPIQRGNI